MTKFTTRIAILAVAVCGLSACGNSPCDSWGDGEPTEVDEAMQPFVPSGATACGSGSENSVRFDMAKEANAFVKLVEHLEGMGYERTHQDIGDPTSMSVGFAKDGVELSGHIHDSPQGNMSIVLLTRSEQ